MNSSMDSTAQPVHVSSEGLSITELDVTYSANGRNFTALSGVDLQVKSGEFVAIVGASGCGKSTLLGAVMGFAPVTAGKITFDGAPAIGPARDRATVFQDPRLLPWRTVLRNVSLGLEAQGVKSDHALTIAQKEIDRVGLSGFEKFYPGQLSGGMQQRVNLARALAVDPVLLMLDEPFAALDAQTRENMQGELLRIWDQKRSTAIFVTHQIDEAIFLADRVVVLGGTPGTVVKVFEIDMERPRDLAIKRTSEFHRYEDAVWQAILRTKGSPSGEEDTNLSMTEGLAR